MTSSIYLSTAPWLAFTVADRSSGLGSTKAAMLAVVVATILAVGGLTRSERDPIVLLALPLFAGLTAMHWLTGGHDLQRYYRALSLLVLGVALGVSIRFSPWSAAYTRRHCPPSSRNSTRFLHENRRLTAWWSFCAVAAAISMAVGARAGGTYWPTLCNWLVPMSLGCLASAMSAALTSEVSASGRLPTSADGLAGAARTPPLVRRNFFVVGHATKPARHRPDSRP